jgi:hypothetical protein
MTPERKQAIGEARGESVSAAWAAMTPARRLEQGQAVSAGHAARSHLPATPAKIAHGSATSAENAARVEAGRKGVEAHVLQMLEATCSPTGRWSIRAAYTAHKQQGGGMSLSSFQLAAGRLRDRH